MFDSINDYCYRNAPVILRAFSIVCMIAIIIQFAYLAIYVRDTSLLGIGKAVYTLFVLVVVVFWAWLIDLVMPTTEEWVEIHDEALNINHSNIEESDE